MRIDAYTHFIPEKFFNKLVESGHPTSASACAKSPASTTSTSPQEVVDTFKDYAQILSYPMPPLEVLAKGDSRSRNTPS